MDTMSQRLLRLRITYVDFVHSLRRGCRLWTCIVHPWKLRTFGGLDTDLRCRAELASNVQDEESRSFNEKASLGYLGFKFRTAGVIGDVEIAAPIQCPLSNDVVRPPKQRRGSPLKREVS